MWKWPLFPSKPKHLNICQWQFFPLPAVMHFGKYYFSTAKKRKCQSDRLFFNAGHSSWWKTFISTKFSLPMCLQLNLTDQVVENPVGPFKLRDTSESWKERHDSSLKKKKGTTASKPMLSFAIMIARMLYDFWNSLFLYHCDCLACLDATEIQDDFLGVSITSSRAPLLLGFCFRGLSCVTRILQDTWIHVMLCWFDNNQPDAGFLPNV